MEPTTLALLVLIPLLIWRVYSRLKRMLARQESQMWRHWASAVLLPLLLLWSLLGMSHNLLAVSSLAAGALAGAWAGVFGLRSTRFEVHGRRYFFTPNLRIGITVWMLFAARIIYRGVELYMSNHMATQQLMSQKDFIQDPSTTFPLGLLLAYSASYSIGMIRWRRSHQPAPDPQ